MAGKRADIRLPIIDECLRDTSHDWTLKDIWKRVQQQLSLELGEEGKVTTYTIRHDIDFIRLVKMKDVVIYPPNKPRFYRYRDPEDSIYRRQISPMDEARLTRALETLERLQGLDIADEIRPIIFYLQSKVMHREDAGRRVVFFDHQPLARGKEYMDELLSSILQKTALRVIYRRYGKEKAVQHHFHPYLLKEYNNRWFCLGYCATCRQLHRMALDRIEGRLTVLKETFIENTAIEPEVFFNDIIGVSHPGKAIRERIKLHVSRERYPYLASRPLHQSQMLDRINADGSAHIFIHVIPNKELYNTLLSFGPDLRVMSPESVREGMRKRLEKTARFYNERASNKKLNKVKKKK